MTSTALSRDEVLGGLRDIAHRLQAAGQPATIQLVAVRTPEPPDFAFGRALS